MPSDPYFHSDEYHSWKPRIYNIATLVVIYVLAVIFTFVVPTFKASFSLSDLRIKFPYTEHETVPMWLCIVLVVALPLIIMLPISYFYLKRPREAYNTLIGFLFVQGLTLFVTQLIKNLVGAHRPDFLSRCIPKVIDGLSSADPVYGLSTVSVCTQTDSALLKDGMQSFFSGHSSASFAGMGFLSLYLAGRTGLYKKRGFAIKGFVVVCPMILALFIAVSRYRDYRHHWHDIFVGSLVGLGFAYFGYFQFFPSLSHPLSHFNKDVLPLNTTDRYSNRSADSYLPTGEELTMNPITHNDQRV